MIHPVRLPLFAAAATAALLLLPPDPAAAQPFHIDNVKRSRATGGIYAPGGAVSSLPQPGGYRGAIPPGYVSGPGFGVTPLPGDGFVPGAGYYGYSRRRGFGLGLGLGLGSFGYNYGYGGYGYGVLPPPIVAPPIVTSPFLPGYGAPLGPAYGPGYGVAGPINGVLPPINALPTTLPPSPETIRPLDDPGEIAALKRELASGGVRPVVSRRMLELPPGESSPEQQARSLEAEANGDRHLTDGNYLRAYARYKAAVDAAPDRPDARLKLTVALAGVGKYEQAVEELDRLLRFHPDYPAAFTSLPQIFAENPIGLVQLKERLARWTAEIPGNPDRLFLLGGLMYFDGDIERAQTLLRSAEEFAAGDLAIAPLLRTPQPEALQPVGETIFEVPDAAADGPTLPSP